MTLPQTTKWYKTVAPKQVLRDRLMAGIHIIDLAHEVESLQKERDELVGLLRFQVHMAAMNLCCSPKEVQQFLNANDGRKNQARVREILENS